MKLAVSVPEEKTPDRISAVDAIEQVDNLSNKPDLTTLERRHLDISIVDSLDQRRNALRRRLRCPKDLLLSFSTSHVTSFP